MERVRRTCRTRLTKWAAVAERVIHRCRSSVGAGCTVNQSTSGRILRKSAALLAAAVRRRLICRARDATAPAAATRVRGKLFTRVPATLTTRLRVREMTRERVGTACTSRVRNTAKSRCMVAAVVTTTVVIVRYLIVIRVHDIVAERLADMVLKNPRSTTGHSAPYTRTNMILASVLAYDTSTLHVAVRNRSIAPPTVSKLNEIPVPGGGVYALPKKLKLTALPAGGL
jgi:hypothetical protein